MDATTADPFARFSRPPPQPSDQLSQQQRYLTPPFSPPPSSGNVPTVDKSSYQQRHAAHTSLPPQALFSQIPPNRGQPSDQATPSRIPTFQGRPPAQFHMPMPVGSAPLSPPAQADEHNIMFAAPPPLPSQGYPSGSGPPPASVGAATKKRATYDPPTGTAIVRSNSHQPSMFSKDQVLSPEYTLHPSIAAYQQSHPRRQLINFGPYILLQTLGEGEFGKVKLGVHREYGEEVAIKLIRRGSVDNAVRLSKVEREIDVLKTVKHPNIVRLFDVIETEKYIGIILDFANGGELFDHILAHRYLKEKDGSKLFAQLISGVHYLHQKKIVHRDLKLENLLLDKHRNVIITDFGFANRFEHRQDDLMATSCGSPCYAAPELVVSDGLYVGSAVDIWSCGVILYAMLSGYLPFDDDPENPDGDNINLLYKYIINTPLTFPEWISPSARDLVASMLVPNPEQRYTLDEVMNHPWLEPFRPLFSRTVDDLESIAQEQMQHKRQASRRDMQARMKAREVARMNHLAQSAGILPGQQQLAAKTAVGPQDHQRRHKSDMPMGFGMASNPMVAPQAPRPIAVNPDPSVLEQRTGMPPHSAHPIMTSGFPPTSKEAVSTPTAPLSGGFSGSLPAEAFIHSAGRPRPDEDAGRDPVAIEADARASARFRADNGPQCAVLQVSESVARRSDTTNPSEERMDSPGSSSAASKKRTASQSANRHTIQVEYDGDAAYERLLETQAERERLRGAWEATQPQREGDAMHVDHIDANHTSTSETSPVALAPVLAPQGNGLSPSRQPLTTITKAQSDSSEKMEVDTVSPAVEAVATEPSSLPPNIEFDGQRIRDIPAPASPVMSPSVIRLVPPTPVKDPLASGSTGPPRTELPLFAEDRAKAEISEQSDRPSPPRSLLPVPTRLASTGTYSSSDSDPHSPRPSPPAVRPPVNITTHNRHPSASSATSLVADLAPSPSASWASNTTASTGASAAVKKERSRKGMSMNSFGFGKLLSGSNMSTDSISPSGTRGQMGKETGGFLSRGGSVREKAKRRAEQRQDSIKSEERSPSSLATAVPQTALNPGLVRPSAASPSVLPDSSAATRAGSTRSRNSLVIQADKILPPHPTDRSVSNASITQFDTFRNNERLQATPVESARSQSSASSSAAQKVMNWFRRKSLVKGPLAAPSPISREPSGVNTPQSNSNAQGLSVPASAAPAASNSIASSRENKENASPSLQSQPESTPMLTSDAKPITRSDAPLYAPQPRRSGGSDQTLLSKLPRPATVGRDLVKQTESAAPAPNANPITSSPFNEARLQVHVGVVDQSALTSKSALEVMEQVQKVLFGMGIEVKRENEFKFRCSRARRRKAGAMTGLGLSTFSNASIASMATLTNASSSIQVDRRGLPLPTSPSLLSAPSGFRNMLMRRGSSQAGGSPEIGGTTASTPGSPREGNAFTSVPDPTYGEHSVDPGDEVKFSIELTRLKNLPGLLSLDIKRLRGNVWSFKFVYQTILERCDLTH